MRGGERCAGLASSCLDLVWLGFTWVGLAWCKKISYGMGLPLLWAWAEEEGERESYDVRAALQSGLAPPSATIASCGGSVRFKTINSIPSFNSNSLCWRPFHIEIRTKSDFSNSITDFNFLIQTFSYFFVKEEKLVPVKLESPGEPI